MNWFEGSRRRSPESNQNSVLEFLSLASADRAAQRSQRKRSEVSNLTWAKDVAICREANTWLHPSDVSSSCAEESFRIGKWSSYLDYRIRILRVWNRCEPFADAFTNFRRCCLGDSSDCRSGNIFCVQERKFRTFVGREDQNSMLRVRSPKSFAERSTRSKEPVCRNLC